MKIAVGILDFLSPPPRNTANDSGPAQRKRSREDSSPAQSRSVDRDRVGRGRESLPPERREERTSGPVQPTTATQADSAAAVEGEVVAEAAASTKRHDSRRPTDWKRNLMISG